MSKKDESARREAAREYARWFLGDEWWADEILDAYLDPETALARVAREKARYAE